MEKPKKAIRDGIRIRRYCRGHEAAVRARLESGRELEELLVFHEKRLGWMMHERLVHLIVTGITAVLFLFTVWLAFTAANMPAFVLCAVAAVLLGAYLRHYFFLENTVQAWYLLSGEIETAIAAQKRSGHG